MSRRGRGFRRQPEDQSVDSVHIRISKCLSLVLRHKAVEHGIQVRPDGYCLLSEVLKSKVFQNYPNIELSTIQKIVKDSPKQRFALLEEDGKVYIRANQGHTIATVQSEQLLQPITDHKDYPVCVHGTYVKAWGIIQRTGLSRMARNNIHFSAEHFGSKDMISGMRSNCQVLIHINLEQALKDGYKFYISSNKVILSAGNEQGYLPPQYFAKVQFLEGGQVVRELGKEKAGKVEAKEDKEEKASSSSSSSPSSSSSSASPSSSSSSSSASPASSSSPTETKQDPTAATATEGKNPSFNVTVQQCPFDYLAILDFEATCDDKRRISPQEIIEFPIVLLNTRTLQIEREFHHYIKPTAHPRLSAFCTELTGITQDTVDQGITFTECYKLVSTFLSQPPLVKVKSDKTPVSFAFVTCGDWDLKTALPAQLKHLGLQSLPCFGKWINIKKVFASYVRSQQTAPGSGSGRPDSEDGRRERFGMAGMLSQLKLPLVGRHHSGIDDSRNICAIAVELLKRGCRFFINNAPNSR